jgi:hydroxymethylglutaryl-CoA reductase (NADPH)
MDTEKKTSFVNSLKGRGRKVTAEIVIPRQVLNDVLRTTPETLRNSHGINTLAAFLTGASNNAAHPANGLAALYMATGQDMANIGEANQCSVYSYVTTSGDLYYSVTLPALIMATYGGGTGLATQRECLELMDCYGKDRAYKLLEIAAGLVVAGELSLVSAARTNKETGTNEWVDAHEKLGRNR